MQHGSIIRAERRHGPDVWEFRWRESGADGERKYRRMVLGSVEQLAASGRNSCSSGDCHVTASAESWRRMAQNEVNDSL